MTVKQLIKKLNDFDPDYEVVISADNGSMSISDVVLSANEDEHGHEVIEVELLAEE